MITKVTIKNFKKFEDAAFQVNTPLALLVGQNNGGKTTALQAISLWNFLIGQWKRKKGGGTAKKRAGAPVSRIEIYPTPIREIENLWHNGSVRKKGATSENIKISITLSGIDDTSQVEWEYGVEATFANKELLYCRPSVVTQGIPTEAGRIFHLPPLSGVRTEEPKLDAGNQLKAIGEGRPGEILRNLLLQLYEANPPAWKQLATACEKFFAIELRPLEYNPATDAFISVYYRQVPTNRTVRPNNLEISNAGSGFLQFLLISSFLLSHDNAVLLIDEPDSHMHVFLQRSIFGWLQENAIKRKSQIIVSTHSEVLINSTDIERIVTFFGSKPKCISSRDSGVRTALSEVSPLAVINMEWKKKVIILEGESDRKILTAFARVLNHRAQSQLDDSPFHYLGTNNLSAAKKHFTSMQSILTANITALCLRDGDVAHTGDDQLPTGFSCEYWSLHEIENYLVHPEALIRFAGNLGIGGLFGLNKQKEAEKYLRANLAPAYYSAPHSKFELLSMKGSDFLEEFFAAVKEEIGKQDYWMIANAMEESEVFPEIRAKLDIIDRFLRG